MANGVAAKRMGSHLASSLGVTTRVRICPVRAGAVR